MGESNMLRFRIPSAAFALILASGFVGLARLGVAQGNADEAAASRPILQDIVHLDPPSPAELQARTQKVIANQHADDAALDQFERVERVYDRAAGPNPRVLEDKSYRVVPIVAGSYKILMRDGDKPVDSAEYQRQLQQWATALELALKPDDSRMKSALEKYQKRQHDRAELV